MVLLVRVDAQDVQDVAVAAQVVAQDVQDVVEHVQVSVQDVHPVPTAVFHVAVLVRLYVLVVHHVLDVQEHVLNHV